MKRNQNRYFTYLLFLFLLFVPCDVWSDSNEGLVAYYPFNSNANDESGNGGNGTVLGAALTTDRFGTENSAYSFDGNDDVIEVSDKASLDITGNFTITAWVNLPLGQSVPYYSSLIAGKIIDQFNTNANYILAISNESNKPFLMIGNGLSVDNGWQIVEATSSIGNNGWVHVAGVRDENSLKVYVNGILENSIVRTIDQAANSAPLRIGGAESILGSDLRLTGKIDEVRVYNRALSESEIQSLFAVCPPPGSVGLGKVLCHQKISDTQGNFSGGLDDEDQAGNGITPLGDLNGDGIIDIALGVHGDDDGGSDTGAIYILFLNRDGTVKRHQKISATQGGLTEPLHAGNRFGRKLYSIGDLDGDGVTDLAVGVLHDSDHGTLSGAVYILFLNRDGTVKRHQKISEAEGGFTDTLHDQNGFGDSVAFLGDVDGDSVGDLAVGAQLDNAGGLRRGAIWVLFLNRDGTVKAHQKISSTEGGFTGILNDDARFGASVAPLEDFDGDGVRDVAVGDQANDNGPSSGAVWLLFLHSDGTVKSHRTISYKEGGLTGVLNNSFSFGAGLDALGDMDRDGVMDLAVGAPHDHDGGQSHGAVWLLFLAPDGTVKSYQKISSLQGNFSGVLDEHDVFGTEVSTLGDINGDGVVDLGVGAEDDDDGGPNRGAAWILFLDGLVNQRPVAEAGMGETVHPGVPVTLNGSGSNDPDKNYPLIYTWELMPPPGSTATLSDPAVVNPSFTPDLLGDYTVQLVVTDSLGASSLPDSVVVSTFNTPPVADAGEDRPIKEIGEVAPLDGTQSFDLDGDGFTYFWTMISKPTGSNAVLDNPYSSTPSFVADVHMEGSEGEYVVSLVVTDAFGAESNPDTVIASFENIKPVANAGDNQSVKVGDTVPLNGNGSSDANFDPLTYSWSIVTKPAGSTAAIADPSVAETSFVADAAGTYVVSLVVNDGFVESDASNITVMAVTLQDAATQKLQETIGVINNLEDNDFKNRNMKNALTNKINAALNNIQEGNYQEALDKLQNDILGKTNGCAEIGTADSNDWIMNCLAQGLIYPLIIDAINLLQGLI